MPPPPPNPFMMHPRFSMPTNGPQGMVSPITHLITNSNDANNSEIIDSSNITPNSTSYDAQSNGEIVSPIPDGKNFSKNIKQIIINFVFLDEKQIKTKKPKKSLKKKIRTSVVKEDV